MTARTAHHLTYEQRCQIYVLLKSKKSKREIAHLLNVHHSTIIREINRNSGKRGYRFKQAHESAVSRRQTASSTPKKITSDLQLKIIDMLTTIQASPQQIQGRLKKEHSIDISHESIYKLILRDKRTGGTLYMNLRRKTKKYNKRSGKGGGRGCIPNRVDIDNRPKIVDAKERFGDFELDTIIGAKHKGAIVSIVDRASKYTHLELVPQANSQNVQDAMTRALSHLAEKKLIHTFTADNGKEFAAHQKITKILGAPFYFAHPYCSWERGLNEHTNGLVRQYFPKKTNFTILTQEQVKEVERKINSRPRKILGYATPAEICHNFLTQYQGGAFHP